MATISVHCEDEMRTAMAAACAQAGGSFEKLDRRMLEAQEGPWKAILHVVYSEIIKSARAYNERHARVLRLPPELLDAVLQLLSVRERLRLAGVCAGWRDVAYAGPVPVDVPDSTEGVAALTERLRHLTPAPLHVTFIWDGSEPDEVATARYDFLREHMWRTRRLGLIFTRPDALDDEATQCALLAALRTPAPQLQRLWVASSDIPAFATLGRSWFDGYAPNLLRCRLSGIVPDAPAFRLVRTVQLEDNRFPLLLAALQNFPLLENLSLGSTAWPTTSEQRWRVPPTLQRLWIYNPANALDCLEHSQILHICLSYPSNSDAALALAEDMRRLQSQPATHVDMDLSIHHGRRTLAIRTVDPQRPGRSRMFILYLRDLPAALDLADLSFGHVAALSLKGLSSASVSRMPEMPALRRLTVVCATSPGDATVQRRCSMPDVQLHCPALQELVLRVAVPLLAGDVAVFIRGALGRAAAGPRVALTVGGAHLHPSGMDDLRALVSSVEADSAASQPELWVESTEFPAAWGPYLDYD